MPLNPYSGPDELADLSPEELAELVAFYKRTARQNGEPFDPEWDRWLTDAGVKSPGQDGLSEAKRRFG